VQKLSFAVVVLILAIASHYPVQLIILGWMSIWIGVYAKIPWQIYGLMLLGIGAFLFTGMPAIALEYSRSILSEISSDSLWQVKLGDGYLYLSRQGLSRSIAVLIRSFASTSVMLFIVLTVPAIDLAIIGNKIGLPSIIIELAMLVYRFIFLLADIAQTIVTAQVARGGYRSRQNRWLSLKLLVSRLIQQVVLRYRQLTLSIRSRASQSGFMFWQPQSYRYSARYALESIAGCMLLIVIEIFGRCWQ
jgi:cobalt/nickel transport system permease protein